MGKIAEFRVDAENLIGVGEKVTVNNFVEGQFVDVTSNSKGKGFAGGMKRHNFGGNRATHGVSISHRSHGSTGQCQDPGKVFKGKKMAGRLGNKKVTIQNLKILNIDVENNLIILKGAVPGHKGSIIKIVDAVKKNQKISINEGINKNINEESSSETPQNINTNPPEKIATTTSENVENDKTQEDEKNIQLNTDSKQTENPK